MPPLDQLAPGWELAQLAYLSRGGRVLGKVRANKLLAFLQLNGFPVPYRFRIIQMGPASLELDDRARQGQDRGLLEVRASRTAYDMDRVDYAVTDEGKRYVIEEVFPVLQDLPHGDLVLDVLKDTFEEFGYGKHEALVAESHRRLHLDDRDELVERYVETRKTLEGWSDEHAKRALRDRVDLAAAATVDFAVMALEAIQPLINDQTYGEAGAFHILAKAEELAAMLGPMDAFHAVTHKRDADLVRRFDRLLLALEENCRTYGILEVPTDEEIEAEMLEAAPYDQDLGML